MTPGNAIVNAMTIDVEDYFHVAAFANDIARSAWDRMEYRAEANTHRLLQLFSDQQIKATFFVLGWVAKRSPQLVRDIQSAGHEIASHGMSHKLVFNQSREEFAAETIESKKLLEDIAGVAVEGYRASTYSITKRSLWALDVLCDAGFKYDSSIFPIAHDTYGIPDAPRAPAIVSAPNGKQIVEFPMSTSTLMGVKLPVSGGGYFRLLPYAITRAGLRKLNEREGRPFVFYLHPWEIDVDQPRVESNWLSRFRHYNNLGECESRLKRLMADFRFSSMKYVLEQQGLIGQARLPATESRPVFKFA